ncbi:MAG: DUF362 domain-containing protein [Candidatus Lokiarchaeota archaeon]|nr:DUF362 domain-containing protein [Candidatus Lokiarchaeota archaeon]
METLEFKPNSNKFVLKPNIVSKFKSGSGHITDIRIVKSLIELLNEYYGAEEIIIAEGPTLFLENPMKLFEYVGYRKLVEKFTNVSLVDIYQTSYEKTGDNFKVSEILKDRCLINLPVLKGHAQAGLTCAIKNLKGLLQQADKKKFHQKGLHENLSTLVKFKPDLTLVDAITCQECEGDYMSKKYKFNLLICAKNPIIVDEVCAKLVGLNTNDIPYLKSILEKEKLNYEIIGEFQQLAEWKTFKNKFTYGKIDVYSNDCCSYCVGALVQFLLPKKFKKHVKLGVKLRVIASLFKKQRTSYIMGRNMKNTQHVKGKVFLFGDCARDIFPGIYIKGCPPKLASKL